MQIPSIITLGERPADRPGIIAMYAGLSHLLLLLITQAENYLLYIWPATYSIAALLGFMANLVYAQWEGVLFSALLVVITWLSAPKRAGLWVAFALTTIANFYLVIDQVGYKVLFDHFHPSMLEGAQRLSDLSSSTLAELDGAFYFNLVLFAVITATLAKLCLKESMAREMGYINRLTRLVITPKGMAILAAFIIVSALLPVQAAYTKLLHHPAHNLLASLHTPSRSVAVASAAPQRVADERPLDLWQLRYGKPPADPKTDQRLDELLNNAQASKHPWNVIWIVMESVGSRQLLAADGRPDPALTPNLARLAENAVIFDSIYSVFPGTVRSHVDMVTGGRTLTWGSVFDELTYPYEGPTMPRAFSAAGYNTALFSAQKLDFENMNGFYKQAGYDYYYDFGEANETFKRQNTLQSWGAREDPILSLAVNWLDKHRDKPFFLQYLTVATHHPYDVPDDFRRPVRGTTRQDNYKNALSYTDAALGRLLAQLRSRHLLDNTLIVINGDHGEAFGETHPQNFLHKNYIYDENIKNFLLIANPVLFSETVRSQRIVSIGDIMPTLLSLAGLPPADVPGQNILSRSYTPRLVYYYKNTDPEMWGLRDGQWKYMGARLGGIEELYNLDSDPNEFSNLADIYPDRIKQYDRLAAHWYAETNRDFVSHLTGFRYPGGREMSESELRSVGPKLMAFGYPKPSESGEGFEFKEASTFNPNDQVVAWTHWVSYPRDKAVHYVWKAPSGKTHEFDFKVKSSWSTTRVNNSAPLPLETGTWQLILRDGDRDLLTGGFTVDRNAPLHVQREDTAKAREIAVGKYAFTSQGKEEFTRDTTVASTDRIAVWTRWKPLDHDRRVIYRWKSPSGQMTELYFVIKRGWDQTWVDLGNKDPAESGRWEVTLWDGEKKLNSATFTVTAGGR